MVLKYYFYGRYSYSRFLEEALSKNDRWVDAKKSGDKGEKGEFDEDALLKDVDYTDRFKEDGDEYVTRGLPGSPEYKKTKEIRYRNKTSGVSFMTNKFFMARILDRKHYYPRSYLLWNGNWVGENPIKLFAKDKSEDVWFLKHAVMNRGEGIRLLKHPRECLDIREIWESGSRQPVLEASTSEKSVSDNNKNNQGQVSGSGSSLPVKKYFQYILQRQVENLDLFQNSRKYDLRMMVLIVYNSEREISTFLYKQGVVRLSSKIFDPALLERSIHLTNYCVQKQDGEGHLEIFDENWAHYEPVFLEIKDVVKDVIKTFYNCLNTKKFNGFTLLGFDFLVDKNHKAWLLEMNCGPSMFADDKKVNQLMQKCVHEMVDVAFLPLLDDTKNVIVGNWDLLSVEKLSDVNIDNYNLFGNE